MGNNDCGIDSASKDPDADLGQSRSARAGPGQLYFIGKAIGTEVVFRKKQECTGPSEVLPGNDQQRRLFLDFQVLGKTFVRHVDIDGLAGPLGLHSKFFLGEVDQFGRLFDLMMVRFNHETQERYLSRPEFYGDGTLFIEFSRGREDGYRHAFKLLSKEILERAAILYVDVTFEESWRRNLARYEEKKKHSILKQPISLPMP